MSAQNKDYSRVYIPGLIIIGILAFFFFIPVELRTLDIFIEYLASWSTIIMVLIYLNTNSKQLASMEKQLQEMKVSRNIQYQPLPYIRKITSEIELPKFYSGPRSKFENMDFLTRMYFDIEIENVGNGPAVEMECEPAIINIRRIIPEKKPVIIPEILLETMSERIECLTLKEGTHEKIHIMFVDEDNVILNQKMEGSGDLGLALSFVYKNVMGAAFKVQVGYWIGDVEEEDRIKIADSYKLTKTVEFDFRAERGEYTRLKKSGNREDAIKLITSSNESLSYEGKVVIAMKTMSGSFKVTQIDDTEYDRISMKNQRIVKQYFEPLDLE